MDPPADEVCKDSSANLKVESIVVDHVVRGRAKYLVQQRQLNWNRPVNHRDIEKCCGMRFVTRVQPHKVPLVFSLIDKGVSLSLVIYFVANYYYDREASVR